MDLVTRGKDVTLKLFLTDTDLLDVFPRTARIAADSGLEPRVIERPAGGKSDLLACYSSQNGSLTVTGLLHGRVPVNFVLKPGTQTYGNFIKFFLRELDSLSESAKSGASQSRDNDVLSGLRQSLERKLTVLGASGKERSDADFAEILDVFGSDFEAKRGRRLKGFGDSAKKRRDGAAELPSMRRAVVQRQLVPIKRQFRLFADQKRRQPQLISGFLSLEIEETREPVPASAPTEAGTAPLDVAAELKASLCFTAEPEIEVCEGRAEVVFRFLLSRQIVEHVEFFVHWGRLQSTAGGDSSEWWTDEEVVSEEIVEEGEGAFVIRKVLTCERNGTYGVTCCAQAENSRERVWAAQAGGITDGRFQITDVGFLTAEDISRTDAIENLENKGRILQGLASFDGFVRAVSHLAKSRSCRGLGRLLFEVTKSSPALRSLVSEYYQRAVMELDRCKVGPGKGRLKTTIGVLKNIGIGEVVFVAPEGPHAIAGGLAQVIVGLTKSLARCGVSCTVITPLYEESQGNKHLSAKDLLARGVQVVDKVVPIKRIGEVKVPFGGTTHYGTSNPRQFPRNVRCSVYMAENEGVRIIFLRHPKLASKLYAPGWADDQVRRAVFLSRGALEVLRNRAFNVLPHIIVTNDWPTALVPVLLRTDLKYMSDPRFQGVETVHIMHNCGQGYQGRFPLNQFGEDLWPMLGVGGEHFFGMRDPENGFLLNFTAGAVMHSGKALVAVSKPYARQLLTRKGGEGLHTLFTQAESALFGVSNGVDLVALRSLFWQVGEAARKELGLNPLISKRLDNKRLIKNLPEYKRVTKLVCQRRYGLAEDEDAVLISLVGRLAEQKGIQLLSGCAEGDWTNVLESVLRAFPRVQFFIGGPASEGDAAARELRSVIEDLTARYPGRIRGVFDFIAHKDALEVTQASDIFLMPSRYEPGGITQLEALAAGTLVVARNVGGIAATLSDYNPDRDEGNSFLFREFSSAALKSVMCRAIETINDQGRRRKLIARAAVSENDWSHRTPKYLSILQHVAGVFDPRSYYAHLAPRWHLLNSLRAVN